MEHVPISKFGKDHWSVFAFLATLAMNNYGTDPRWLERMRCNPERHPGLDASRLKAGQRWNVQYSTRLKGYKFGIPLAKNQVQIGHDDWDCAYDLEAVGLLKDEGTGINPYFILTDRGIAVHAALLKHKQSGKNFAEFSIPQELASA